MVGSRDMKPNSWLTRSIGDWGHGNANGACAQWATDCGRAINQPAMVNDRCLFSPALIIEGRPKVFDAGILVQSCSNFAGSRWINRYVLGPQIIDETLSLGAAQNALAVHIQGIPGPIALVLR